MRAISQSRNHYAQLATTVSRAVREKSVVVAARASHARGDAAHTASARVVGDQRAQVDCRGPIDGASGQLTEYIRADLVAPPANGRTEMQRQMESTAHQARKQQLSQAIVEIDKRLAALSK